MKAIEMEGGRRLNGEVTIQGSKNAVLPMMAASLLCKGTTVIHGCPKIEDVFCMIELLKYVGCKIRFEGHTIEIDAADITKNELMDKAVRNLRASVLFLGSLLGRSGSAEVYYPGGCNIGKRPIDFHLKAFEKMGADVSVRQECISCEAHKLSGAKIHLDFPSVGATENIILAAVLAEGITWIGNAAREPEVVELCRFLRAMGAVIEGEGTEHILIQGVTRLYPVEYTVPHDRIVLSTFGLLIAGTGGSVILRTGEKKIPSDLQILSRIGCQVKVFEGIVSVRQRSRPKPIYYIKTRPYPGFPTDVQSLLLAVLAKAEGDSIVEEGIFENRFRIVAQLKKMGADIETLGNRVYVRGTKELYGSCLLAEDLRGGAALVLAGLMAEGISRLEQAEYIARGYENYVENLKRIGAKIQAVD